MKSYFLFFIFYFLLVFSCDEGTSPDTDPPSPPAFTGKSAVSDTSLYEIMAIDAVDGPENRIRLIWQEHPGRRDLDHFTIYRSEDSEGRINYFRHAQVEPDGEFIFDGIYHTYTDGIDVDEEKPYYYYITAVDKEGNESSPSDTTWYQLVQKAGLTAPLGQEYDDPEELEFNWVFTSNPLPNGYILRIEEDFSDVLAYVEWVEPLSDFDQNYRTHRLDAGILRAHIISGVQYRWRIDCLEKDPIHYGSESNWGTFIINWGE